MKRVIVLILICLPTAGRADDIVDRNAASLARLAKGDQKAIAILVQQGESALPGLLELLREDRASDPLHVVIALAEVAERVGPRAKLAVPALCEALRKPDRAMATMAARALGSIGPDAVPEVVKTLASLNEGTQAQYPIRALRHIGPGAKEAAPILLKTIQTNRDPKICIACIEALGALGPTGTQTTKELLIIVQGKAKSPYTTYVILALGGLGADAKEAIPYLAGLLDQSTEAHLRLHALEALSKIGPDSLELNDRVASMLELPDMPKVLLLGALGRGGPLSSTALKHIEETLRSRDHVIRLHGAMAFGKKFADHPAVVSILIESLNEKDTQLRRLAAETLGLIRPTDEAVIIALQSKREDPDPSVRQAVAQALERFSINGRR